MKKVFWITPDCFTDVDMPIIPRITKYYNVHWLVVMSGNNRYKESDFDKLCTFQNLKIDFLYLNKRKRNPKNIQDYLSIKKMIDKDNPDIIYNNLVIASPWILPFLWSLPKNKTIQTAHQGVVHGGMDNKNLTKLLRSLTYPYFKYINMFSKSQAELFRLYTSSKPRLFQFYLPLKDFGPPSKERPSTDIVRFLSFGQINYAKHLDLLIRASCGLYESGVRNFRVSICGKSSNWDEDYAPLIKYPEIFENDIRMIDNDEIPDLFNGSHFFVQPYRILSQSGPMKISFNYNLPLITSDLVGFRDEMVEGKTGYMFKSENEKSLQSVMKYCIELAKDPVEYQKLRSEMQSICEERYSWDNIISQYVKMFNEVIEKQ